MLEVGQKNVRDGYMAQAEYDKTAPKSLFTIFRVCDN
jgi:hypothetical protein